MLDVVLQGSPPGSLRGSLFEGCAGKDSPLRSPECVAFSLLFVGSLDSVVVSEEGAGDICDVFENSQSLTVMRVLAALRRVTPASSPKRIQVFLLSQFSHSTRAFAATPAQKAIHQGHTRERLAARAKPALVLASRIEIAGIRQTEADLAVWCKKETRPRRPNGMYAPMFRRQCCGASIESSQR